MEIAMLSIAVFIQLFSHERMLENAMKKEKS